MTKSTVPPPPAYWPPPPPPPIGHRRGGYRDLSTALMRHSWLALTYALATVILIYALGLWTSANLLFFSLQIPTLAAVIYVTSGNDDMRFRFPIVWSLTALIAWTYRLVSSERGISWASEALALGVILLLAYWLVQAIYASSVEFRKTKRAENTTAATGWLLSAWGITLQLAFIALLPIQHVYSDAFRNSILGIKLVGVLEAIRFTSPFAWLPTGVFITGLTFFVVLRFADFPYRPADFREVLPGFYRPIVNEIVAAVRIPVWLIVVIAGFLSHFVWLLVQSFLDFADEWMGRLVLALIAIIFPVLALLIGHNAFFRAMVGIAQNLAGEASIGESLWLLLLVHLLILLGLFLYVIAAAPIGLEVIPISIRETSGYIRQYFLSEGSLAAQATGKAFALYGIIFLAVPLACLLPGGATWGVFSTAYAGTVATLALMYFAKSKHYAKEASRSKFTLGSSGRGRKAS